MVREERSGATVVSALDRLKWYFLFSSRPRRLGFGPGAGLTLTIGEIAETTILGD
jgi:hypothetical protein